MFLAGLHTCTSRAEWFAIAIHTEHLDIETGSHLVEESTIKFVAGRSTC